MYAYTVLHTERCNRGMHLRSLGCCPTLFHATQMDCMNQGHYIPYSIMVKCTHTWVLGR
jgi:hypothetical protein